MHTVINKFVTHCVLQLDVYPVKQNALNKNFWTWAAYLNGFLSESALLLESVFKVVIK